MEFLTVWATAKVAAWAGGSIIGFILLRVLRRIPNDKIKKFVGKWMKRAGVLMTLGMSRWKYTAPFWNKTIEPWFIDLIDNVVAHGIQEFIKGLKSDNQKKSEN